MGSGRPRPGWLSTTGLACLGLSLALAVLPSTATAQRSRAEADDGSGHDGRWLVILSSSKQLGLVPAGELALRRSDLPHHLTRLRSSEFKGLQPCYEIVVADSFATAAEARAYSRRLAALGIDNYAKNAGEWVGRQPRVEAYCRGERSGENDEVCSLPARLVATHEGRHFLSLGLDPVVAERALAQAGQPSRLTDQVWLGEVGARTLGDVSQGDAWTAWTTDGVARSCRVERFVAVTRGVPHWAAVEHGLTGPGCGKPVVMAELRCDGGGPLRVASRGGLRHPVPSGPVPEQVASRLRASLEELPAWSARATEAAARAAEEKLELEESFEVEAWRLGDRTLLAARGTWAAGDGGCGARLVHAATWALVDGGDGRLLIPPLELEQADGAPVPLDLDGEESWGTWQQRWGGATEIRLGGKLLCRAPFDYCDCGC